MLGVGRTSSTKPPRPAFRNCASTTWSKVRPAAIRAIRNVNRTPSPRRVTVNRSRSMDLRCPVVGLVPRRRRCSRRRSGRPGRPSACAGVRGRVASGRGEGEGDGPEHHGRIVPPRPSDHASASARTAASGAGTASAVAPPPAAGRSAPCGPTRRPGTGAAGPRSAAALGRLLLEHPERVELALLLDHGEHPVHARARGSARPRGRARSSGSPSAASPSRPGAGREARPLEAAPDEPLLPRVVQPGEAQPTPGGPSSAAYRAMLVAPPIATTSTPRSARSTPRISASASTASRSLSPSTSTATRTRSQ